ncbi:type 1 glutamine amidotransferase domain-containing protein [Simiduia aestuariiviva]|uniref:Putative intracellular protease/amidase n=1 Tax=Simiduia aestuariiviva TaxID=1510459 RepID=A0A839UNV4_9GAMM|nr:type 1 glutamine amidotransferase domain-containing protein [Simiduia aestuariiviva]MBB3167117.1 putative intracellular protease/amidase [Simiduia aestuariiviva]
MWKKLLLAISALCATLFVAVYWFFSLFTGQVDVQELPNTQPESLAYVASGLPPTRGNILIVVTSQARFPGTDTATGYELTELSRAYYVFTANGFQVDVASPQGGYAPMVLDNDDMGPFDYAFLNDPAAQKKYKHTMPLADVNPENYRAVYFAGGKGTMFDFPNNPHIANLLAVQFERGGVVAAVCHGPAALLNAPSLAGRNVTGFTNAEELFLIPDARTRFGFLLEDALIAQGANFSQGPLYLHHVVVDGSLITGQNPWSVWTVAEEMVAALGYVPVPRAITAEERSVTLLQRLELEGVEAAMQSMNRQAVAPKRMLLAMHVIVSLMKADFGRAVEQLRILNKAKELASN